MSKLLASAVLGLGFAFVSASAQAAEPNATLTRISGNVSVNQGQEFVPAQDQMRLSPGDRIMVADDASATLTFNDACRLDVEENKIITVPDQSTCAGARVVEQGVNPSNDAAIGSTGIGNGGVLAMVGIVAAIDLWWLSEDDDETVSP